MIPKHRLKVLLGGVAEETKRLMGEACERNGLTLLAVETDVDHVHCFVSAPPRWSPAQIANVLNGYTSRIIRERFPDLKKASGRDLLWTQSYYVGTVGDVSTDAIWRYGVECQGRQGEVWPAYILFGSLD